MMKTEKIPNSDEYGYVRFRWWKEVWRRLKKNKIAIVSLAFILLMCVFALFPNMVTKYGFDVQDMSKAFTAPGKEFPLGTDSFGRCILSRLIHGTRISLSIGFIVVSISLLVGGIFGVVSAYYKKADNIIMRFMDLFMAIPSTLLAIVIAATLGPSMINLMIAVGVGSVPKYARVVRSACLTVKNLEFIEAAQCVGADDKRIIFRHILPNALSPIIVQCTMNIADAIITAAGLSFIGLGVQPPTPEWGTMLSGARQYIRAYPYMVTGPAVAIMLLALSFNILGDGLRDALDPKLKT